MNLEALECTNNINIKEYIEFVNLVKSNMTNPDWLGDFKENDINNILNSGGRIWIYYKNSEIVCSVMYMSIDEDGIKKFNLDYDKNKVGECGQIMVNPKYIGLGLQNQMLKVIEEYSKKIKNTIILTTIHPDNIYSKNNFIKNNYKYDSSYTFKRGRRDLYIKYFGDNE